MVSIVSNLIQKLKKCHSGFKSSFCWHQPSLSLVTMLARQWPVAVGQWVEKVTYHPKFEGSNPTTAAVASSKFLSIMWVIKQYS
jgi:hypothetical protein